MTYVNFMVIRYWLLILVIYATNEFELVKHNELNHESTQMEWFCLNHESNWIIHFRMYLVISRTNVEKDPLVMRWIESLYKQKLLSCLLSLFKLWKSDLTNSGKNWVAYMSDWHWYHLRDAILLSILPCHFLSVFYLRGTYHQPDEESDLLISPFPHIK